METNDGADRTDRPVGPRQQSRQRVVRLDPSRRRGVRLMAGVVGAVGVGLSAMMLLMGGDGDTLRMGLALVPVSIAAVIVRILVRGAASARLEILESGLEYHAWGTFVRARWDDIAALERVAHGPYAGEGLRLRNRAEIRASLVARLIAPTRGIPLAPFVLPLTGSWLHIELSRRAPHLAG